MTFERYWQWLSVFFAIVGISLGIVSYFYEKQRQVMDISFQSIATDRKIDFLENILREMRMIGSEQNRKIEELERLTKGFANLPSDAQARAMMANFDERLKGLLSQLEKLERASAPGLVERLTSVAERLKRLEDAIVQDASKAVSILLISKDIEAAKKSIDEKFTLQNASIDRLYNILFGSIFVIALSVISQAVSAFFGRKNASEAKT
jgi:hypothetical protein